MRTAWTNWCGDKQAVRLLTSWEEVTLTMADDTEQFKRWLVRSLQEGTFEQLVGCEPGECAAVEFHLQRIYQVILNRRTAVVHDRDSETIRQRTHGRWHRLGPAIVRRERIVLARRRGRLLQSPRLGSIVGSAKRRALRRMMVPCG